MTILTVEDLRRACQAAQTDTLERIERLLIEQRDLRREVADLCGRLDQLEPRLDAVEGEVM